jgi:hypothetical protein
LFQRAIDVDPEFASPYAAARFRYAIRQTFGYGIVNLRKRQK